MSFTPHTHPEREAMLALLGLSDAESLFADIPEALRRPGINLPEPVSQAQLMREMHELAGRNAPVAPHRCFLGAGTYHHHVPPIVDDVISRPSLYSAYTPYQPEVSQGMLQAMFEYQSMAAALCAMPISNASHYDGATSLAEAVMLALGVADNAASRVLMSGNVHPQWRQVTRTYLQGQQAELVVDSFPTADTARLVGQIDAGTAALVIQTPGFLGELVDLTGLADAIHAVGGLLIVVGDPVAMALFEAPGSFGADVVVAEGQSLGMRPNFGGPRLGIFTVRNNNVRRLVGRLVGQTHDSEQRRGYVLTLATREQHIRRARATSNICTNASLSALTAAAYMAALGREGLRETAELCFQNSHYLAAQIHEKLGLTINPHDTGNAPWFREFVIELPCSAGVVDTQLWQQAEMIGGLDLAMVNEADPQWANRMLLVATDVHTKQDLDSFVDALGRAISRAQSRRGH